MIKKIRECELIPAFYGGYRRDVWSGETYVMVMPLHLFAGLFYALYSNIRYGWIAVCSSSRDAYNQGYAAAKKDLTHHPKGKSHEIKSSS